MEGLILGGSNNIFQTECDDGIIRQCTLKGKQLKLEKQYYNPIAPGDRVEIECDEKSEDKGQILSILPRKNECVRWNVKGRLPQLLACNVDNLLCFTTPDEPPFRPRFVDRVLAQAENQNIEPVIVCNKYDLADSMDEDFEARLTEWERIGYKVLRISAKSGEGVPDLAQFIEGKLSVLVGQSGVGKSSLVNVLDSSCVLRTGSLSDKYGRGTHTTTRGSLIHLNINEALLGGRIGAKTSIIDTPGVRRFVLHDISADNLQLYFKEIAPLVGKCSFGMSCTHTKEPGCKIQEGVYAGVISEERYDSFCRIKNEIATGNWED